MANSSPAMLSCVLGKERDQLTQRLAELNAKSDLIKAQIQAGDCVAQMLNTAKTFYRLTGRHIQSYGDLGELYAVAKFGVTLHKKRNTEGSDGKIGNTFVEVKTITPLKGSASVRVKRNGNFSKLVIVKICEDYAIKGRMIPRENLPKGDGDMVTVHWAS